MLGAERAESAVKPPIAPLPHSAPCKVTIWVCPRPGKNRHLLGCPLSQGALLQSLH